MTNSLLSHCPRSSWQVSFCDDGSMVSDLVKNDVDAEKNCLREVTTTESFTNNCGMRAAPRRPILLQRRAGNELRRNVLQSTASRRRTFTSKLKVYLWKDQNEVSKCRIESSENFRVLFPFILWWPGLSRRWHQTEEWLHLCLHTSCVVGVILIACKDNRRFLQPHNTSASR